MHVISDIHGINFSGGVMWFVILIDTNLTNFESLELDLVVGQVSFTIRSFLNIYWHAISLLINSSSHNPCVYITSRELTLKVARLG